MQEPDDGLDAESTRRLLKRQARLQREAQDVLADLGLIARLESVGRPMLVGSVVSGLMVWPDIDFNIVCRDPRPGSITDAMRPLFDHPALRRLSYHNETGAFNSTGNVRDEGYYVGLRYHAGGDPDNAMWKIDCWFLPEGAPREEAALLARLERELTDETRLAILWIKDAWYARPSYRDTVLSVDIYDAVLDHGVRTPAAFAAYLRERGKPDA